MPVSVHVPLRIRVGADALQSHPAAIDRAVAQALGRTLRRSREELADRYGEYLPPDLAEPRFTWTGPGLAKVGESARQGTERRLPTIISDAAAAAGIGPQRQSDQPLTKPPAEAFDHRRALSLGRYRLDSYEAGEQIAAPLDRIAGGGASVPFQLEWERADVDYFVPDYVRQRILGEAMAQHVPLGRVYGLLVRGLHRPGWTLMIAGDDFMGSKSAKIQFGPQMGRRMTGLNQRLEPVFVTEEIVPPLTSGAATELPLSSDPDERSERLHAIFATRIRTMISDAIDPAEEQDEHLSDPDDLEGRINAMVEAEVAQRVAESAGSSFLLRIDWGEQNFYVKLPQSLASLLGWDGQTPATILPGTRETQEAAHMPFGTGGEGGGDPRPAARHGGGGSAEARGNRYGTMGEGTGAGTGHTVFPSFGGGDAFVCEPFEEAEPELDALPGDRARLESLVAEIAERLDMEPCGYPATFCVGAAHVLAARAAAVGGLAGFSEPGELTLPPGGGRGGNVGPASFRPSASRGIQLLRRLSQAAARIAQLRRLIANIYLNGDGRHQLRGRYSNDATSWVLHFHQAVAPEMKQGVGEIFAQTCQLIMLQLLDSSAQQIAARKTNIASYAPLFRDVLVRRLANVGTLTRLRDRLRAYEAAQSMIQTMDNPVVAAGVTAALPSWAAAARDVAGACVGSGGFAHLPGIADEIVVRDGVVRIRDEHGFLWTRDALETEIHTVRGEAESLDPLIQQLADIPENVERFRRDPAAVEPFLIELLDEMELLNRQKRLEAMLDRRFGLRVGKISEDVQGLAVPGVEVQLAGIHRLAHDEIYPFFGQETGAYAEGLNEIFGVELGIQGFEHFATFTGLILLAVLCPPAAFAAGVAVAAVEVHRAEGRRDLYRALINPELVLNRTEIELERYIAYVGLALSLLPEAGTAARAISVGVRGGARSGAAAGLRLAGRSVVRHVSRQVTEQLARDMLPALVRELATNLLMEQVVVPHVVGPIIAAVERELAVRTSVGGIAGAERLIAQIEQAAARRTAAALPAGLDAAGGP